MFKKFVESELLPFITYSTMEWIVGLIR